MLIVCYFVNFFRRLTKYLTSEHFRDINWFIKIWGSLSAEKLEDQLFVRYFKAILESDVEIANDIEILILEVDRFSTSNRSRSPGGNV